VTGQIKDHLWKKGLTGSTKSRNHQRRKSQNRQTLKKESHVPGVKSVIGLSPTNVKSIDHGQVNANGVVHDLMIDLANSRRTNPLVVRLREIAVGEEITDVAGLHLGTDSAQVLPENVIHEPEELLRPAVAVVRNTVVRGPVKFGGEAGHGPGIQEDGAVQRIEVDIGGKPVPRQEIVAVEVSAKIAKFLVIKMLREEMRSLSSKLIVLRLHFRGITHLIKVTIHLVIEIGHHLGVKE